MTLTVTAAPWPAAQPAIRVDVASSPSVTDLFTVWRVHEDGTKHQVLTSAHATLIGTTSLIDFYMPFNQLLRYQVVAGGQTSALSAATVCASDGTWLIHPTDPALSVLVDKWMAQKTPFKYAGRAQKSLVLNSRLPRSRSASPRAGESGSMQIECKSEASRIAVRALFDDGGPILINTPYPNDDMMGWKWVQPDDLDLENPGGNVQFPLRYAQFTYEQVEQPDADVRVRTYGEVKAMFPGKTYAQMKLIYSSYRNARFDARS